MSTVLTIMDRGRWDANTDNIAVVDADREEVLSVPRDLWCKEIAARINAAFARGGHAQLIRSLGAFGIHATNSVCLRREATERAFADAVVTVPVPEPMIFWYPLEPKRFLQEGRKLIRFDPPEEKLAGERIHQWLGARRRPDRSSSDLERIERQHVFVRALLESGFDFGEFLREAAWISSTGADALAELRSVAASWRFHTFDDVTPRTIDGQMVLVPGRPRLLERIRQRLPV